MHKIFLGSSANPLLEDESSKPMLNKQPAKTKTILLFIPSSFLRFCLPNGQTLKQAAGSLAHWVEIQETLEFREIIQYRGFVNEKSAMVRQFK
jgi:hypothetical protein